MKRLHKNQKGFTLVELMVVVVIIGILIAIAIPIFNTVTANAERRACHANQRTAEGAAMMYRADNTGFPLNVSAVVTANLLLADEAQCPTETHDEWTFVALNGRIGNVGCTHSYYRDHN